MTWSLLHPGPGASPAVLYSAPVLPDSAASSANRVAARGLLAAVMQELAWESGGEEELCEPREVGRLATPGE